MLKLSVPLKNDRRLAGITVRFGFLPSKRKAIAIFKPETCFLTGSAMRSFFDQINRLLLAK
jgi:hypothetical protein